jgi:hypothetical protein
LVRGPARGHTFIHEREAVALGICGAGVAPGDNDAEQRRQLPPAWPLCPLSGTLMTALEHLHSAHWQIQALCIIENFNDKIPVPGRYDTARPASWLRPCMCIAPPLAPTRRLWTLARGGVPIALGQEAAAWPERRAKPGLSPDTARVFANQHQGKAVQGRPIPRQRRSCKNCL